MKVQTRLDSILKAMEKSAQESGRKLSDIHLMAVSKTHTYEEILALYGCSQMLFGENRVQEVEEKFVQEKPVGMKLHLIGHLQSNKVKKIVPLVDGIDSVDSLKLARLISRSSLEAHTIMPILLQYNTSEEASKSGFESEDDLYRALDAMEDLQGISIRGLMTIGPLAGGEKETRSAFAYLKELQQSCIMRYPHYDFSTLSMGMSSDFPLAIQEGATMVRVGTALFGERLYR
ncbi:MAG: YggS family pyridoxal phosphate-dependent enzyme [Spirochaetia bacterium]|jgi:pyridoxal phosphate enzyme (YggS family)|nr:YggS family pyridoxal phosphate-dependent enzyme [Spirochaetia bacterium]